MTAPRGAGGSGWPLANAEGDPTDYRQRGGTSLELEIGEWEVGTVAWSVIADRALSMKSSARGERGPIETSFDQEPESRPPIEVVDASYYFLQQAESPEVGRIEVDAPRRGCRFHCDPTAV